MRFFRKTPPAPLRAGTLMHLSSLPSAGGVGTMGEAAYRFVDFLAASGLTVWQMLPVGPAGYGESPYQSFSAFAGDALLIDLPDLVARGLLRAQDVPEGGAMERDALRRAKDAALRASWRYSHEKVHAQVRAYARRHAWLNDWALFAALKARYGGIAWQEWPEEALVRRDRRALAAAKKDMKDETDYYRYVQWLFSLQWEKLRAYAHAHGVLLFGDMPIYASADSADCWANRSIFQLDGDGRSTHVAGVPPDYFSEDGQRWGNPLYNWKELKRTRYGWWVARMRAMAERFDWTRIDHFIGFANYYAIPAASPTARVGEWRIGPGRPLFRRIERAVPGLSIIAEDLGEVGPRVQELLRACGYPGMRVMQFGYDGGEDNPHLPENYIRNCVAYTGTHDNDTLRGYLATAGETTLSNLRAHFPGAQDLAGAMLEALFQSKAGTVIAPMQDFLGLGGEARMNVPGTVGGANWLWRMAPDAPLAALVPRIRALCCQSGRTVERSEEKK